MLNITPEKEAAVLAIPEMCADKIIVLYHSSLFAPNLGNYSLYKLMFGRKPRPLINLDLNPDIKISGTFREYYEFLNKRIKYLQDVLFNFKSKRLAMINKDRAFFQYKSGELVYIISLLTSQLCTASWKVTI